jgi:hypothetical protein
MNDIFSSGTSSVLLNGVLGRTFHCKRGVRQGDPLSPLLFVLAADFLQVLVNRAKDMGLLRLPLPIQADSDFPIVQYADDTLIIMEGDPRQLFFLKTLLYNFFESTGLKVNYNKSMIVPINISEDRLDLLARTFGCSKGSLPFTYLGLPLGVTKPKVIDFLPLVNKCERRLGSINNMLNQAGRLQVTNVVLSSLPTFYMCTLELPKAVIKQIDKFRKNCLWRGSNINGGSFPKAAWEMVCTSKEEGGLWVIDLELQNQILLMKNLDKFFNKRDIPWVHLVWEKHYKNGRLPGIVKKGSFWWRDTVKLLPNFKKMADIQVKNGTTCFFWKDKWTNQILDEQFPQAHSFARNKVISVKRAFATNEITEIFNLPLSQVAFDQVINIQQIMDSTVLSEPSNDVWTYSGGATKFKSAVAYRKMLVHNDVDQAFRWVWKSFCQPKHKVFYWLLLKDRLSTRNILRRKHMALDSYNCEFCFAAVEETVEHLFWHCPFAQHCWGIINLQTVLRGGTFENVEAIKVQMQSQFFMVAIILMCWTIWWARNELIFNNNQVGIQDCRQFFFKEVKLVSLRVKASLAINFELWIQSL